MKDWRPLAIGDHYVIEATKRATQTREDADPPLGKDRSLQTVEPRCALVARPRSCKFCGEFTDQAKGSQMCPRGTD